MHPGTRWASVVSRVIPPRVKQVEVEARVRLHAPDGKPTPVRLRAYAFDRYPARGEAPLFVSSREAWLAVDHGEGQGRWVKLGHLDVARDTKGRCRFCVGWTFDERRDPEATTFEVLELRVVPA